MDQKLWEQEMQSNLICVQINIGLQNFLGLISHVS